MLAQNDIETVRQSVLFKNLPEDVLDEFLHNSNVVNAPRRKTLFIQGEPADHIYVVLEGWVKLTRITPAGEEVVVTVYSTGETFGEAAALKGGTYPVSVEAVTDCRLLAVKAPVMLDAILTKPEIAIAMLTSTFQHLHELVLQIEGMKALSGPKRLAAFLIAQAPVDDGSCTFSLPYDKVLIAGRLGMKPESLSRAFAKLRTKGVVVSRNHITIADVEQLHDYVDEEKPPHEATA